MGDNNRVILKASEIMLAKQQIMSSDGGMSGPPRTEVEYEEDDQDQDSQDGSSSDSQDNQGDSDSDQGDSDAGQDSKSSNGKKSDKKDKESKSDAGDKTDSNDSKDNKGNKSKAKELSDLINNDDSGEGSGENSEGPTSDKSTKDRVQNKVDSIKNADTSSMSKKPKSEPPAEPPSGQELIDQASEHGKTIIGSDTKAAAKEAEENTIDLSQEDKHISVDEELRNMLDSIEEMEHDIEVTKESKESGKAAAGLGGLSDITISDRSYVTRQSMMQYINKWIKKLIGERPDVDTIYVTDSPSRKVQGLWGRELDEPPPEAETKKSLLFVFDTSGSMDTRIMGEVCSDIALKLNRAGTIEKVGMVNLDGLWETKKKVDNLNTFKMRLKRFLKISTGSEITPAWREVNTLIKVNKANIHGMVIISDFQISNYDDQRNHTHKIPQAIAKRKIPMLLLNLSDSDSEVLRFYQENPGQLMTIISVHKKNVRLVKFNGGDVK